MEESIADPELQRRIQITSLLQHGGFKMVMERIQDLKECFQAETQLLLTDCVNAEKVALLNHRLGKLFAVNAVLAIRDELLEEITPSDGDTSEEVNEGN